jgi:hypothetical protein
MMDKIQQKRHQRQQIQQYTPKINDGSLSDTNYVTYDQTNSPHHRSSSPYSWLQPASTYAAMGKNSGGGGGIDVRSSSGGSSSGCYSVGTVGTSGGSGGNGCRGFSLVSSIIFISSGSGSSIVLYFCWCW